MLRKLIMAVAIIALLPFARCKAADTAPDHSAMDVVLLGDSNTWIGGDDCDKPQGWNYWWRETFRPRSCRSYARSGATWTNTSTTRRNLTEDIGVIGPDNVIYNQVCRLIAAADGGKQPAPSLIIIAAGTNDAWFSRKRPGLWSDDAAQVNPLTVKALRPSQATSLARSVMLSCALLSERFPDARIVLLTPHQTTATTLSNITRVAEMIERCGNAIGIPVLRQDLNSGIVAADEKVAPHFTTDGTHTSIDGARHVAAYLNEAISSLIDN